MKKKNLKSLKLTKTLVTKLDQPLSLLGGAKSFRLADCQGHPTQVQTCQYSCLQSCYCYTNINCGVA